MAARIVLFVALFAVCLEVAAADRGPGFGVVQSIILLPGPGEESASAGASAAPKSVGRARHGRLLVRLKMDDGTYQVREVKGASVRVGQRALVTNAGDVVPE